MVKFLIFVYKHEYSIIISRFNYNNIFIQSITYTCFFNNTSYNTIPYFLIFCSLACNMLINIFYMININKLSELFFYELK